MVVRSRCRRIARARCRWASCWLRPAAPIGASSSWLREWKERSVFDLTFTVIDREGGSVPLTLPIDQAVIAGWTGRDPVARDKHIAELEALGIKRPATTPIYYRASARRLNPEEPLEA